MPTNHYVCMPQPEPSRLRSVAPLLLVLALAFPGTMFAIGPPCAYSRCVALSNMQVAPGATVRMVPLLFIGSNGGPLPPTGDDIHFTINYDARALAMSAFPGADTIAAGKSFSAIDLGSGRKRISITGANQNRLGQGAQLADLLIRAQPLPGFTSNQTYPVTITDESIGGSSVPRFGWGDGSVTVVVGGGLGFIPLSPCRLADTRTISGPSLSAGQTRSFSFSGLCGVPSSARAYSLNTTVVPRGPLGYLTLWPSGSPQPYVSTLNALNGSIRANAAIAPGGNGGVSVYATGPTDVILDVNGYFDSAAAALAFYPLTPCRLFDTRLAVGVFGGPSMRPGEARSFPVLNGPCGIPPTAQALATNVTVVPQGPLSYLTAFPSGSPQPLVSTLNALHGLIVANAALLPLGLNGASSFFVTDQSDLLVDVNGYFAPRSSQGLAFYPVAPCRAADTRNPPGTLGGPVMAAETTRDFEIPRSPCGIPDTARAFSLNVTVVPEGPLAYLSIWPTGQPRPLVSTLNSTDGSVLANAAIVPAGNQGSVSVFVTGRSHVILDINGYFAPY